MCCDLILRRRLGKRGKRPQRAYERDGDFAGLLALDLCREIQNSQFDKVDCDLGHLENSK